MRYLNKWNMKVYGLMICLWVMVMSHHVSAQVTVTIPSQSGTSYSLLDISSTTYLNTGTQKYSGCYADITASNLTDGQTFVLRTAPFTLTQGLNTLGYSTLIGCTVLRPSDDYYSLEQKGKFPEGKYSLCIVLYSSAGTALGKECINLDIEPMGSLMLIYPTDEEVLNTFTPILSWQTTNKISDNKNTYNIHIAELLEGQSYSDAISINPPLVYEKDLSTGSYSYPSAAPALEEDKKYVWQVEVVNAGRSVTYSEIWMFQFKKPKNTPVEKKPKTAVQQYPHLTKSISSAVYQYSDKIYFMYDNYANDSLLDYSIIKSGASSPLKMDDTKPIVLKPFNNYLAIPVTDQMKKEGQKSMLVLQVHNSRKENWALKFSIKSKK